MVSYGWFWAILVIFDVYQDKNLVYLRYAKY